MARQGDTLMSLLLRIAAVLASIQYLAHAVLLLRAKPQHGKDEADLLEQMQRQRWKFNGFERSYWDLLWLRIAGDSLGICRNRDLVAVGFNGQQGFDIGRAASEYPPRREHSACGSDPALLLSHARDSRSSHRECPYSGIIQIKATRR